MPLCELGQVTQSPEQVIFCKVVRVCVCVCVCGCVYVCVRVWGGGVVLGEVHLLVNVSSLYRCIAESCAVIVSMCNHFKILPSSYIAYF